MFAPEIPASGRRRGNPTSFNEAGACLPRKVAIDQTGMGEPIVASMRPGHVCPGNPPRGRGERARYRFNEAGACLPRKRPPRQAGDGDRLASMRPGHVCPGNPAAAAGAAPNSKLQ